MKFTLMQNYQAALQELYDHVGFEEDWVIYPIDDNTDKFWATDGHQVFYADSEEELKSQDGNYYEDDVYKQRFYKKWIYRGKEMTMIFCHPHVDGMKWFRLFDNAKERPNTPQTTK